MSMLSARKRPRMADVTGTPAEREVRGATIAPITLSERSISGLALIRIFVGYLWFQQLFWKLPPSFTGLHKYVVEEVHYTILPGYSYLLQHVFLPNFILLGTFIWIAELLVSVSLLFGLFTRFGALLSVLLAIQLYTGIAFAPGEWYWTYGMLVLLGFVLVAVPAGRRFGIDQYLEPRLKAHAHDNILSWFV